MRRFIILFLSDTFRVIKCMKIKYPGRVTCMEEMENAYRIIIEKCEGMIPLRKLSHTLDNIIKIYLKEQHMRLALVKTVINLRVLQTAMNFVIN
jgi:hypothetical protein